MQQHEQTYRKLLEHALAMAGGPSSLASRLGIGVGRLRRWLAGEETIPDAIFLEAVDVVTDGYEAKTGRHA